MNPSAWFRVGARSPPVGLLAAALLHGSLAPPVAAQAGGADTPPSAVRGLGQMNLELWGDDEDLFVGGPMAAVQDVDGYLWVGTQEGAFRFDGVRFHTFTTDTLPRLSDDQVRSVLADPSGGVWLGTLDDGVVRLTRREVGRWGVEDGLPSESVLSLARDRRGRVWVGTAGDGLAVIEDGRARPYRGNAALPDGTIRDLAPHPDGGVWVGTGAGGLVWARLGGEVRRPPGSDILPAEVRAVAPVPGGGLWVGTTDGLYLLEGGAWTRFGAPEGTLGEIVYDVMVDARGDAWIAYPGAGVQRYREGRFESLTTDDGLPSDNVWSLARDREGGVWIVTRDGGIVRLSEGSVIPLTPDEGLSNAIALPILRASDGDVWVGTFGGGVTRYRGGRAVDTLTTADGLSSDFVLSLAETSDGALWIGTRSGLNRFRYGRIDRFGASNGLPPGALSLLADPAGGLWIGTNAGLARYADGVLRPANPAGAELNLVILALHLDGRGRLWLGTEGRGVFRIGPEGDVRRFGADDGLKSEVIYAFHEEPEGALWVGTQSGGLARIEGDAVGVVSRRHGLFDNQVYRIIDDGRGHFWMCSNRGIFRAPVAQLRAVAEGRSDTVSSPSLGRGDGMPSAECNGGVHPAGAVGPEGDLWFPTMRGVAVVDVERALGQGSAPPTPVVEAITTDGEESRPHLPDTLEAGTDRIAIRFTAPTFHHADKLRFQYRLDDHDDEWIDGDPTRQAIYTNLWPGDYRLRVRTRRPEGPWSSPAEVAFVLAPRFYQTVPFFVLCAVLVSGTLFGAHRLRIRTLQRRERELVGLVRDRERAERRYRELFANATDVIFTLDPEGRLTEVNREASRVFRRAADELRGRSLPELFSGASARAVYEALEVLGPERPQVDGMEVEVLGNMGDAAVLDLRLRAILEEGEVLGIQGMARDVTEERALQHQLIQSQKLEAVGRLASGIAHDFNNLITAIQGYAHLAQDRLDGADAAWEDVREIWKTGERAQALTRKLLNFGRSTSGRVETLDLNDVVGGMQELLQTLLGDDVVLRTEPAPEPVGIEMDRIHLEQVLLNLALNARDAMRDGGTVTVRSGITEDGRAALAVEDTGGGIPAEELPRIFEPFYTTKDPDRGTGLGLSVVRNLLEAAGGEIEVESRAGEGTTFRVLLPLREIAEPAAVEADPGALPGGSETVLVVEDDHAVRELIRKVLTRSGYAVVSARSADEALETSVRTNGDVDGLVTDLSMPGMSGLELVRAVRDRTPGLPALVISGHGDRGREMTSESSVGYLAKPFTPDELLRAVRALFAAE